MELASIVSLLARHHGEVDAPPTRDPYELAIWENVAYLVDDGKRRAAYDSLAREVGLAPREILTAPEERLQSAIAAGGMQPARRADKLRACAALAEKIGLPSLREAVRDDPAAARKLLKRFPGFGEPGADKVLLFAGGHARLAPDSNALRVLLRLGFGDARGDYARQYRSVASLADGLDGKTARRAHLLLRHHGQTLCKRSHPLCEACPLAARCAHLIGA